MTREGNPFVLGDPWGCPCLRELEGVLRLSKKTKFLQIFELAVTKVVTALADSKCVGTRQTNENSPQKSNSRKNQMLVLSRKVGEKLVIDGNITVEVVRIQGNRITLGLVAPADVKILRGELNQNQLQSPSPEKVVRPLSLLQAS